MLIARLIQAAVLVLAVDQAIKAWVLYRIREREAIRVGFVVIRPVIHVKRSMTSPHSRRRHIAFWLVEIVAILLLVRYGPFFQNDAALVALGSALGGATSNLIDLLRHGGVIDFLDLRIWPVFNLADAAITIGVVTAIAMR